MLNAIAHVGCWIPIRHALCALRRGWRARKRHAPIPRHPREGRGPFKLQPAPRRQQRRPIPRAAAYV